MSYIRKLQRKVSFQKMTDLPVERCTEVPPFTYCRVNTFGPYLIKEKISQLKRNGALFICFTCCTIYIEVTNALNINSFIATMRKFIARGNAVRSIWSDNGTNFVGTRNELQQQFKERNSFLNHFFQENGANWIEWHHNPPAAPHMDGLERQTPTARNILEELLQTHFLSLNDKCLRTLITEAEIIGNSRVLTVETLNDANTPTLILSSNLLTLKIIIIMPPPGEFSPPGLYSKNRWQRVQYIVEAFWNRLKHFGIVSTEPANQTKMAKKKNTKFHCWRYSTVKGLMLTKPVDYGKNCHY